MDHTHAELASAPGRVKVGAGERKAEVPDRALGYLLVEGLPEAVVVDDRIRGGVGLVEVDVVGPKGPQGCLQLADHLLGGPVVAADRHR